MKALLTSENIDKSQKLVILWKNSKHKRSTCSNKTAEISRLFIQMTQIKTLQAKIKYSSTFWSSFAWVEGTWKQYSGVFCSTNHEQPSPSCSLPNEPPHVTE